MSVLALAQPAFGEWIETRRKGLGLTLRELSETCHVPSSTLAQAEAGRDVRLSTATRILHWLMAPVAEGDVR